MMKNAMEREVKKEKSVKIRHRHLLCFTHNWGRAVMVSSCVCKLGSDGLNHRRKLSILRNVMEGRIKQDNRKNSPMLHSLFYSQPEQGSNYRLFWLWAGEFDLSQKCRKHLSTFEVDVDGVQ